MPDTLPAFTGTDAPCPKCNTRAVRTRWLVKPEWDDNRLLGDPWYHGYLTGNDRVGLYRTHAFPFSQQAPAWWPEEWLGRECTVCGYRWDEAVAEPQPEDRRDD